MMVLVVMVVVVMAIVGQVVADGAARSTAQPRTHKATGGSAHLAADDLTTRRTESTTNGRLGLFPVLRRHRAACSTADSSADRSPSAAAGGITHHAAQGTSDTATDSCGRGLARHDAL